MIKFRDRFDSIIIKPLNSLSFFRIEDVSYYTYTKIVDDDLLESIPEKFSFSLFQEYIEKQFEIRSFFLNREEFSMAIFSQQSSKTMTDFRNYDKEYPNRRVPFKLPEYVREKVLKLMDELHINTGSFDFIFSKSGEYVFLEVNPVGQFGMVSMPCNYYLEKKIALSLINENKS